MSSKEALNMAVLSNVGLAEVLSKLTDRGQDIDGLVVDLRSAGLHLEPVSRVDAEDSAHCAVRTTHTHSAWATDAVSRSVGAGHPHPLTAVCAL